MVVRGVRWSEVVGGQRWLVVRGGWWSQAFDAALRLHTHLAHLTLPMLRSIRPSTCQAVNASVGTLLKRSMATEKQLKQRMVGTTNIAKITKSMKMVPTPPSIYYFLLYLMRILLYLGECGQASWRFSASKCRHSLCCMGPSGHRLSQTP